MKQPHFRSYWIQDNVSEVSVYASGVVDLFRTPTEIREERVFIRAEEKAAAGAASAALGEIVRLVPDSAGLYRAWVAPVAEQVTELIVRKVLAPRGASAPDRAAPSVALTDGAVGGDNDFESRIDREPPTRAPLDYQTAALMQLMTAAPLRSLLHVESTRAAADVVFVNRGVVIAIAREADWPATAARDALRTAVAPMWTKGDASLSWTETRQGSQSFWQLAGLEPLAVAERGALLLVANDPALLVATLDGLPRPAAPLEGAYAGGFRHSQERQRFVQMMRVIDFGSSRGDDRSPMFFSGNLASLSETLSRVDSAAIVVREAPATTTQTVTYRRTR